MEARNWMKFYIQRPLFLVRFVVDSKIAKGTIIWSNYSDLTRPISPKWWFRKGNPLISGKCGLVKYYNLARIMLSFVVENELPGIDSSMVFIYFPGLCSSHADLRSFPLLKVPPSFYETWMFLVEKL